MARPSHSEALNAPQAAARPDIQAVSLLYALLASATFPDGSPYVLPIASGGLYDYAAGDAPTTVDVPADARARRISVVAATDSPATITIAGGDVIPVPAGGAFDESLPGDAPVGGDVVIGGQIRAYYVAWTF